MKILNKIISLFFGLFKKVAPVAIIPELDKALENKVDEFNKEKNKQLDLYDEKLKEFLKTYFGKPYSSSKEMGIAFNVANKQWKKLVRNVNSTNKYVTLDKAAFEKQCINVIDNLTKKQN